MDTDTAVTLNVEAVHLTDDAPDRAAYPTARSRVNPPTNSPSLPQFQTSPPRSIPPQFPLEPLAPLTPPPVRNYPPVNPAAPFTPDSAPGFAAVSPSPPPHAGWSGEGEAIPGQAANVPADLIPRESLFDRSIAERRRVRRGQREGQVSTSRSGQTRPNTMPPSPATHPPAPRSQAKSSQKSRTVATASGSKVTPLHRREPEKPTWQDDNPYVPDGLERSLARSGTSGNFPGSTAGLTPTTRLPRPQAPRHRKALRPVVYSARLAILGVGISAITGTMLSLWNPAPNSSPEASQETPKTTELVPPALPVALQRTEEIAPLKASLTKLAERYPDFQLGVAIVDVDTGAYVSLAGANPLPAASTIKLPILVALFQAVDLGTVRLDEKLTLAERHVAIGSGNMQYDAPGTQYTLLDVATQMIVTSDNTATNLIIERLGGLKPLNEQFQQWGLNQTQLNAALPDLEGTNVVSPDDMANLFSMLDRGELVSLRSRDRLLNILEGTQNDSLLPQALGEGAIIAHKTGNIKNSLGDVGLIDLPNGKRYVVAALVQRPPEDDRAYNIIQDVSREAYKYFTTTSPAVQPDSLTDTQQAQRPASRPGERSLDRPEP